MEKLVPLTHDEFYDKIENEDYESKLEYASRMHDVEKNRLYRKDDRRLYDEYKKDLRRYLDTELGLRLTDKQFQAVFDKVWEDGHSSGYSEVLIYAGRLIELLEVFLK